MQERKIKTLQEVLGLERQPTLQEIIDLSLEDYAKYLYHIGVINYAPEVFMDYWNYTDDVEDDYSYSIVSNNTNKYDPCDDDIMIINEPDYEPMFDRDKYELLDDEDRANEYYMNLWDVSDNFNLYESDEWNNPNIIEKGTIYFRHGVEVEYSINNKNILTLYEKNTNGKYWNPTRCHKLYYLEKLKENCYDNIRIHQQPTHLKMWNFHKGVHVD